MTMAENDLKLMQIEYVNHAKYIVTEAEKAKIQLRILGAICVIIHCPSQVKLLQALKRNLTDIDFVASAKQEREIEDLFKHLGYEVKGGRGVTMEIWSGRRIFEHPTLPNVDVFFDELDFCHKVDFRKRLNLDFPTISLTDLMLEKLQIVEINEKDLKDLIVVNLEHPLSGNDDPETINAKYISDIMAKDWGFYHTSTINLNKVKQFAKHYEALDGDELQAVKLQIDQLLEWIESVPKTLKWKARSRIGTKLKWYKNPGEEYREI